ncbi:hypothetical protein ACTA71_001960 [Dictyostelium dimigraforme]
MKEQLPQGRVQRSIYNADDNSVLNEPSNPSSATNSPRTFYYGNESSVKNSPFITPLSSPRGPISPRATINSPIGNSINIVNNIISSDGRRGGINKNNMLTHSNLSNNYKKRNKLDGQIENEEKRQHILSKHLIKLTNMGVGPNNNNNNNNNSNNDNNSNNNGINNNNNSNNYLIINNNNKPNSGNNTPISFVQNKGTPRSRYSSLKTNPSDEKATVTAATISTVSSITIPTSPKP